MLHAKKTQTAITSIFGVEQDNFLNFLATSADYFDFEGKEFFV